MNCSHEIELFTETTKKWQKIQNKKKWFGDTFDWTKRPELIVENKDKEQKNKMNVFTKKLKLLIFILQTVLVKHINNQVLTKTTRKTIYIHTFQT